MPNSCRWHCRPSLTYQNDAYGRDGRRNEENAGIFSGTNRIRVENVPMRMAERKRAENHNYRENITVTRKTTTVMTTTTTTKMIACIDCENSPRTLPFTAVDDDGDCGDGRGDNERRTRSDERQHQRNRIDRAARADDEREYIVTRRGQRAESRRTRTVCARV